MRRIQPYLPWCESALGASLFGMLFLIVSAGIFARYFFGRPIFWIEEMSNFLFIWFGFLACSTAYGQSRHMAIDIFVRSFPRRLRIMLDVAKGILLEVVFIALLLSSFRAMAEFKISSALRIQESYVFVVIPVTFSLLAYHNLVGLFRILRHMREPGETFKKGASS
ncbi:MAG: TRAP transporter small permease [Deltaproteobacteria bacterium]|nr:TRAP transporter small permease [Deltaproteobacteria bacterium]